REQHAAQTAMHRALAAELAVSRELLADIEVSALGLKETVDAAAEALASLARLGRAVASLRGAVVLSVLGVLVSCALRAGGARRAGCLLGVVIGWSARSRLSSRLRCHGRC
ncbi:hypothetical protein KEM52_005237, partial [Ascosphaera acerosa]